MKSMLVGVTLGSCVLSLVMAANDSGPPATATESRAHRANSGGLDTAMLYAVVNGNGTLSRSSGANDVVKTGPGAYRVIFRRNVRECAYTATAGRSGALGTERPGGVNVVEDNLDTKGVYVTTYDMNGAVSDRGFHLNIFCA